MDSPQSNHASTGNSKQPIETFSDEYWMQKAIAQGHLAAQRGEVPIGAVIVCDQQLIAASHDRKEISKDPTAHAEIEVIRHAANYFSDWRFNSYIRKQEKTGSEELDDESSHGRKGRKKLNRLESRQIILYVTLEPCLMCLGAILQSRVTKLVFGAENKRWSLKEEQLNEILQGNQFNHRVEWVSGVLEPECRELLQSTFNRYRNKK